MRLFLLLQFIIFILMVKKAHKTLPSALADEVNKGRDKWIRTVESERVSLRRTAR
ncbi:hypothetical protein D3C73_596830 [compost metagenome]